MENLEEKIFNEIKNKFKEKGYDNVLDYYRGYDANNINKTKISADFLSVDKNTKIPLLAFEVKRRQNIEEMQQPTQNMLKEIVHSIEGIKNIYKNIKYLEFYLIIFNDDNKKKIFKVNIKGEYEEIHNIDYILNKSNKTIQAYIEEKNTYHEEIKFVSSFFVIAILVIYFVFSLFPEILSHYIKWILLMIGIMYGLLILPYVKEVNFWGLQIKNFDVWNKK